MAFFLWMLRFWFFLAVFKNENVVLVELDFPRRTVLAPEITEQNNQLQQFFAVQGYPTVWFVNATLSDGKINMDKLGSTGYLAGGPKVWVDNANSILKNSFFLL